ncbi:MAG: 23S rRNA (adenine(2503)-C(2))-methyltransferase RlmN [Clostridia bacterium]|nr:23S rRNA (adenine(2503)-C(2))-methyltransferase RlmN [Clostridia bacterium]
MYLSELESLMKELGEPKFRAGQIFAWLQSGVDNFDEMTNIPSKLREKLQEGYYIVTAIVKKRLESNIDDTVKYLYELYDGELVETVLMKYKHGYSVCVSTQVGCRMGCSFCASGLNGLKRSLTASEILAQITSTQKDRNIRISNVVLMGMGEPMDNLPNVIRFLKLVSDEKGLNIGLRHISVSTSGVVSGIYRLMEEKLPITLSISLHAPNDAIRTSMMPVNKKWNIAELIKACKDYIDATGRRISFEYAVVSGINDSDANAKELAGLLRGMLCHLNLIPVNPVKENSYKKPDRLKVERFCRLMNDLGINTTIRRTLGSDIDASCGQLRGKAIDENQ